MKFIKLEIKNLASLDRQDGEVIEFEKGSLGNSNIFSIVGPMGSGKSTILDAICLALYKLAPRYPRKKGERQKNFEVFGAQDDTEKNRLSSTDCRNILTRGKKEGYSKLTFLANSGVVYRAEWYTNYKLKKYGDVVTKLYKITASNGKQDEEEADWDELPQIIGLDYEQFLRTVLIAQGTFANLLKASDEEKCVLLEKLIGCEDKYKSIAEGIKQKKDEAVDAYKQLEAQIAAFKNDMLPQPDLVILENEIKQLEVQIQDDSNSLKEIEKNLDWYAKEEKQIKDIKTYQDALNLAQERLEAMKADIERLDLHDSTLEAVEHYKNSKSNEGTIKNLEDELNKLEKDIAEKGKTIADETAALGELSKKESEAKLTLESRKPSINEARRIKGELASVLKTVEEKKQAKTDAENALNQAKKNLSDNTGAIKKAKERLESATSALNNLNADIENKKKELSEAARVATEAFEKEQQKTESKDAAKLQEAKERTNSKLDSLRDAIALQKKIGKAVSDISDNSKERELLDKRIRAIDEELAKLTIKAIEKELDTLKLTHTLMTSENWQEHRSHLNDGEACPLCGSTHHPYKDMETLESVVSDLQKLIDDKSKSLNEQKQKKENLTKEKAEKQGQIRVMEQNSKELDKQLSELDKQLESHYVSYPDWKNQSLETILPDVEKEARLAAEDLKTYNDLVVSVERLRKVKDLAEKEVSSYTETANKKLRTAEGEKAKAEANLQRNEGMTAHLEEQVKERETALVNASEALENALQEVENKTRSIKEKVGDNDPDELDRQLEHAKNAAGNAVNKKKEVLGKLREELEGLNGKKTVTQNSKRDEEKKLAQNKKLLDDWIDSHPPITIAEITEISSAKDNWEAIRKEKQKRSDAVTAAKTTCDNEVNAHNAHQTNKPADSEEVLAQRKVQKNEDVAANTKILVDKKTRKQKHDDAMQKTGALAGQVQSAEVQKKDWEDIYSAIGSNGDTLRKVAQCYTLRFLIAHANAEIRKFNSRYELQQVKNSLGIRVIDHDRADDIRDTTSLSGGETFIVSLGLALGLSSLSSCNISFGNLFIDEGFGSLDADTLGIVIDSLAMLQSSQGKKVGVISHTNTMSERITTQIRIIKNGNSGSSHIEIYP